LVVLVFCGKDAVTVCCPWQLASELQKVVVNEAPLPVMLPLHCEALTAVNVNVLGPPALPNEAVAGASGVAGPKLTGAPVPPPVAQPVPLLLVAVACK